MKTSTLANIGIGCVCVMVGSLLAVGFGLISATAFMWLFFGALIFMASAGFSGMGRPQKK